MNYYPLQRALLTLTALALVFAACSSGGERSLPDVSATPASIPAQHQNSRHRFVIPECVLPASDTVCAICNNQCVDGDATDFDETDLSNEEDVSDNDMGNLGNPCSSSSTYDQDDSAYDSYIAMPKTSKTHFAKAKFAKPKFVTPCSDESDTSYPAPSISPRPTAPPTPVPTATPTATPEACAIPKGVNPGDPAYQAIASDPTLQNLLTFLANNGMTPTVDIESGTKTVTMPNGTTIQVEGAFDASTNTISIWPQDITGGDTYDSLLFDEAMHAYLEDGLFGGYPYFWGGQASGGGTQMIPLGGINYSFNLDPIAIGNGSSTIGQSYAGYEHLVIHNLDIQLGFPSGGALQEALTEATSNATPAQIATTTQNDALTTIQLPLTASLPTNQKCNSTTQARPGFISPSTAPVVPYPTAAPTARPAYVAPSWIAVDGHLQV